MEPDDLGHHLGSGPIERDGRVGVIRPDHPHVVGEFVESPRNPEEGVRGEAGGDHPLGDEDALGDDQTPATPAAGQGG